MKKIILILLLFIPFVVSASECNTSLYDEYSSYASKITYDNDFRLSRMNYNITFYNVIDGLHFQYDKKNYYPIEGEIQLTGIEQGKNMEIYVYGADGCNNAVRIININEPYYNPFYGTSDCIGYENRLSYCSTQFLSLSPSRELFEMAKKNIDNGYKQEEEKPEEKEVTLLDKVVEFAGSWGVKIALFVITCVGTFSYYHDKFRKVKHGI